MDIKAFKMDGLGNDFVIIDNREKITNLTKDQIVKICDRNFIGCDQLIFIEPDSSADASLRFFNSDGGESGACGNGTRCAANLISKEKAWPLVPIIEKAGMIEPNSINWLDYLRNLKEIDLEEDRYLKWESNYNLRRFLLTKSIEEAANNNNKTLTVLLIARIIGDNPLIDFDLNSLITIMNSLKSIGLDNLSKIITQEIMTSKIVNL